MLPITSAYVKSYDGQTKWMYFLIEDDDLLEKYNTIWDRVSVGIKKELDSKTVYNNTKITFYIDEAREFHDKETPKVGSSHTCLEKTLKKDENYYLRVFLKECKYIGK